MFEPLFVDAKEHEVQIPDIGGPLADTHAHLDMLKDPGLALARAAKAGVVFVAAVADPSEDALRTLDAVPGWLQDARELLDVAGLAHIQVPRVRTIVGVHPHNAKDYNAQVDVELRRMASRGITSAIGEIGLDYHYDYSPREVQQKAFREQLATANELGLTTVVHLREAHEDGEEILRQTGIPEAGCILHCYTLGIEPMARFLDLGCAVSFAGPVTFKKADELRTAASAVPLDRVLTETDCPFMAPEPFRGRENEPALVVFTAARLAEVRGEDRLAFATTTHTNAVRLLDRQRS